MSVAWPVGRDRVGSSSKVPRVPGSRVGLQKCTIPLAFHFETSDPSDRSLLFDNTTNKSGF